jgi:acetyl esterase/lipase
VATGGNSAGANLATVVVRKLRDSGRKERVAAEILRVPATCHPSVFPEELARPDSSYYFFDDVPILPTQTMDDFWEFYNPGDKAASLDCSPLLATEFREFPPTYISVCGCDPLRDQGVMFANKLEADGVKVKFEVMAGFPHGRLPRDAALTRLGHNMWPHLGKGCEDAMTMMIGAVQWAIEEAKAARS